MSDCFLWPNRLQNDDGTDQSLCGSRRSEIRLGVKLDSESQIELTVMAVKVAEFLLPGLDPRCIPVHLAEVSWI